MKTGIFNTAIQKNDWAYFCKVEIEVETNNVNGLKIEFNTNESKWHAGVTFGLSYIHEKYLDAKYKGIYISVKEIQGHIVDTTESVAAYTAAGALLNALNIDSPQSLNIIAEEGIITFPK